MGNFFDSVGKGLESGVKNVIDPLGNVTTLIKDAETSMVTVLQNGAKVFESTEKDFFNTVNVGITSLRDSYIDTERNVAYDYKDTETRVFAVISSMQKNFFQTIETAESGVYATVQFTFITFVSVIVILLLAYGDSIIKDIIGKVLQTIYMIVDKIHIG